MPFTLTESFLQGKHPDPDLCEDALVTKGHYFAVVDGATGETLTRGELAARSAALAAGLRAGGVRPGDLVAVAIPNLAWWPVVALGVWRAGAAVSPLSPLWTADESARVLARAVPRAAVCPRPTDMRRQRNAAGPGTAVSGGGVSVRTHSTT